MSDKELNMRIGAALALLAVAIVLLVALLTGGGA